MRFERGVSGKILICLFFNCILRFFHRSQLFQNQSPHISYPHANPEIKDFWICPCDQIQIKIKIKISILDLDSDLDLRFRLRFRFRIRFRFQIQRRDQRRQLDDKRDQVEQYGQQEKPSPALALSKDVPSEYTALQYFF